MGCAALALWLAAAVQASATVINFEEFPADDTGGGITANRYAGVGVTFTTTDDGGTIGGLGAGDPGNWGVAGTNGSTFSGFNGGSYAATIGFASAVNGFRLDSSRTNGSSVGDTLTVSAYLLGSLLGTQNILFGDINSWTTVSFSGLLDEIRIQGNGSGFHPFGVDNLVFGVGRGVPEPSTWALMIGGFGLAGVALRRRAVKV